ncbi:MAG TPA: hypothetical protein VHE34_30310 [Puia sp.]|uniref:hypothetical protein n=1 Tax=Puia sp. TaxID=2045100 RepID=UPI002B8C7AE1|nr:hypothetical protein [Puia sp.]HVU99568.1 hypothetical protein [Puia sp.]
MKIEALFTLLLTTMAGYSQTTPNTINNYKYVLVPHRFDFQKSDDQYALNTTTKSLLEQKGFNVYWTDDVLPPSLAGNKCAALQTEVTQRKAMFTTNLTLVLKDCLGNIVFKGKEGRSREKEFYVAYDEAMKDAFTSLNATPYNYDSTLTVQSQPQQGRPQQTQPQQSQPQTQAPPQSQSQPQSQIPPTNPGPVTGILYAQSIPNGYQLIDLSPKKIMTLLKTSQPDFYLARTDAAGGAPTGVVFKKDGQWLLEYYKDDKLISQKLDIKF